MFLNWRNHAWTRQTAALVRCMASCVLLVAASAGCASAQAVMNEPDDPKPVQITGCMTARTKLGAYVLSGVFGRPVTVIGPAYLQVGLGRQVTLTGTWQSDGTSTLKDEKMDATRMFVATSVKVSAKQCASPPSAPQSKPSKASGSQ